MNQVIRKSDSEVGGSGDQVFPPATQVEEDLSVTSQLSLGVVPRLRLSWKVGGGRWSDGFRLLVFHNTSGFANDRDTDDLSQHGQLIIDTTTDGSRDEHPTEGKHFYTFLLHKKILRYFKQQSVVRFSETVTTAKIGIDRIRDKMELDNLQRRHELGTIEHEANVNEAEIRCIRSRADLNRAQGKFGPAGGADLVIAQKIANVNAIIATLKAKHQKIEELRNDALFTSLDSVWQNVVWAVIEEEMEPGDVRTRKDRRES